MLKKSVKRGFERLRLARRSSNWSDVKENVLKDETIADQIIKEAMERDFEKEEDLRKKFLLSPYQLEAMRESVVYRRMSKAEKTAYQEAKWRKVLGPNFEAFKRAVYQESIYGPHDAPVVRQDYLLSYKFSDNPDAYTFPGDVDYELDHEQEYTKSSIDPTNTKYRLRVNEDNFEHPSMLMEDFSFQENFVGNLLEDQVFLGNLPINMTPSQILKKIKGVSPSIKKAQVVNCKLNLPAYAVITESSKERALLLKRELNTQRLNGKLLQAFVKEDSYEEDPRHRTLVIAGIQNALTPREIMEELMSFGSIVSLEYAMSSNEKGPWFPTTEEVIQKIKKSLRSKKTPETIEIHELGPNFETRVLNFEDVKRYEIEGDSVFRILSSNEAEGMSLDGPKKERVGYNEILSKNYVQNVNLQREVSRIISQYDSKKKVYYSRSRLLDVPSFENEMSIVTANTTQGQIVFTSHMNQKYHSRNMGYVFVTFATSDQARNALINLTKKGSTKLSGEQGADEVPKKLVVTLRHDSTHMQWDLLFAYSYMKEYQGRNTRLQRNLEKKVKDLAEELEAKKQDENLVRNPEMEKDLVWSGLTGGSPKEDLSEIEGSAFEKQRQRLRDKGAVPNFRLREKLRDYIDSEIEEMLLTQSDKMENRLSKGWDEEDDGDDFDENDVFKDEEEIEEEFGFEPSPNDYSKFHKIAEKIKNEPNTLVGAKRKALMRDLSQYSQAEINEELDSLISVYAEHASGAGVNREVLKGSEFGKKILESKELESPAWDEFSPKKILERKQLGNLRKFSSLVSSKEYIIALEKIRKELFSEIEKLYDGDFETLTSVQRAYDEANEAAGGNLEQSDFILGLQQKVNGEPFLTIQEIKRVEEMFASNDPEVIQKLKEEEEYRKFYEEQKKMSLEYGKHSDEFKDIVECISLEAMSRGVPDTAFKFQPNESFESAQEFVNKMNVPGAIYRYEVIKVAGEDHILRLLTLG